MSQISGMILHFPYGNWRKDSARWIRQHKFKEFYAKNWAKQRSISCTTFKQQKNNKGNWRRMGCYHDGVHDRRIGQSSRKSAPTVSSKWCRAAIYSTDIRTNRIRMIETAIEKGDGGSVQFYSCATSGLKTGRQDLHLYLLLLATQVEDRIADQAGGACAAQLKQCQSCGKCAEQMDKCRICREKFKLKWYGP